MKITNHYIKSIKLLLILSVLFVSCSSNTIDGVYKVIIESEEKPIILEITYTIELVKNNLYNVTMQMTELDRDTKAVNDSRFSDLEALYSKENRTLTFKKRKIFFAFSEDLNSFTEKTFLDGIIFIKNKTVKTTEKEIKENKKKNKK